MLFNLRTFSYDVKSNFKSLHKDDIVCRLCKDPDSFEDEIHTFESCKILIDDNVKDQSVKFEHVFADINLQVNAIQYLMKLINKQKLMLELQ